MSRTHIFSGVLVLALGVAFVGGLAACGSTSSQPAPTGPTTTPPEDDNSPVVGPPQVAWKDMSHEQRARYMTKVVMPTMAPLFQGFDAKRFAGFSCDTCHGKGVADHSFKMPNPDILALPGPDKKDEFTPIYEKMPDMVNFMGGKVMPEMAKLLGAEPFDYTNPKPEAFSCLGCHTQKP